MNTKQTASTPTLANHKMLLALYLAMAAVGMGQTVVFAVIPMLGRELQLDQLVFQVPLLGWTVAPQELAITSLSAVAAIVFFFVAPLWGRLSDRWGRKRVMLIGLVGYALGSLVFNFASYLGLAGLVSGVGLYLILVLGRAFHAAVMSGTHPACAAYMVDVTTVAERTRGLGRLQASNQIGIMFGPVLAWFVSISFLAPLFIQAAVAIGIAILVWRFLPTLPVAAGDHPRRRHMSYFDPRYRLFVFIGFVLFSLVAMVQQTLGFYFQDTLGLDSVRAAQMFSSAMVLSSASMIFAQFVVVQRFRGVPARLLVAGMPFSLLAYLVLANAHSLGGLLGGMALFGFGLGMTGPAFTAAASLEVEAFEQGELAGMLGSIFGLGFVFGPLLGGALYRWSPSYPYWVAALVIAITLLVLQLRSRGTK